MIALGHFKSGLFLSFSHFFPTSSLAQFLNGRAPSLNKQCGW